MQCNDIVKFVFRTILFVLLSSNTLKGQGLLDGFMKGKGNIVTSLSYSNESYNTYFVGDEKTQNPNLGTIRTNSFGIYAAGGITDYLDVIVSLPYITAKASEGYLSNQSDFQDFSFFVKARILNNSFINNDNLTVIASGGISTSISDYIADFPISIGNQSTQLDGRFIAQYKFLQGAFVAIQSGYIKRGNIIIDRGFEVSVPDSWDYIIRAGGSYKKWYADTWFQHQNSNNGTSIGPGVPFPSNEIDFTRIGFTLYHPLPKCENFGIALSGGTTLSGTNIGMSNRFSTSLIYNFSVVSPSIK